VKIIITMVTYCKKQMPHINCTYNVA